jgi:excisionase family DNA binding protein
MIEHSKKKEGLARITEAVEFLGISRAKLYSMMEGGELPYVKLGKSRRLRWSDLEALVEKCLVSR